MAIKWDLEYALLYDLKADEIAKLQAEVERLRAALVEARNNARLMVAATDTRWAGTPSIDALARMAGSAHQRAEKIVAAIDAALSSD